MIDGGHEGIIHGAAAVVRTDFPPRRDAQESRRRGADAPVFGGKGLRHRLALDERRPLRRGRGGAGDDGIDEGRAPLAARSAISASGTTPLFPASSAASTSSACTIWCPASSSAIPAARRGASGRGGRRAAEAIADVGDWEHGSWFVERDQCATTDPTPRALTRAEIPKWSSAGARRRGAPTRRASKCSTSMPRTAT